MNQEYLRASLLSFTDMTTIFHSVATSLSNPFTNSDLHHTLLINDDPENYDNGNFNDESAVRVSRECPYARTFMFLDMTWNMAFVLVSVIVLLTSVRERPSTPLRLWICGYTLQCLLHVGFVWAEYQSWSLVDGGGVHDSRFPGVACFFASLCNDSIIKKLESINMIISSIWWVFGFYWIVLGGQLLLQDSPRLYWLSMVFLAFDVFFVIFCIAMACIFFFVLFCFFPILATVAYAMTIGEGASEDDIRSLPKYLYRHQNALGTSDSNEKQKVKATEPSCNSIATAELILQPEDSECCICLYKYLDGTELCALPCNHHFHHHCITKWLRINATCPLCKFNILKGDILV